MSGQPALVFSAHARQVTVTLCRIGLPWPHGAEWVASSAAGRAVCWGHLGLVHSLVASCP